MNFNDLKYKANYYAILLLAFVIPLERKLAPPLIILFLITSILNKRADLLKNYKILFFTFLFFLYLLGITYTPNIEIAITNITEKLSLLIFPLAIYLSNIDFKNKLQAILFSFIDGCIVAGLLNIVSTSIEYYFKGDSSIFFYGNISTFLHASYFAMYLCFGIIILYYYLLNSSPTLKISTLKSILTISFFSIFVFLLASKTGLITLILIHFSAILFYIIQNKAYKKGILAFFALLGGIFLIYKSSSIVNNRINELIYVVSSGDTSDKSTTGARVEIWKIAANLIKVKPLIGYGTGNEKNILTLEYEKKGFLDFAQKHLNTHNQFLQTTVALGLIGGLTFLFILIIPAIMAIKNQHYLYLFFIVLIIFNFFTESMLERQSGVVFYSFFNSLLCATFVINNKLMKE